MLAYQETPVKEIQDPLLEKAGVRLLMKLEYLNHPFVSGNKWWKLKYNLEEAKKNGKHTLLTFGGAYSNHIYATAAAAKESGFNSIGIIRGEEVLPLNDTLSFAQTCGMKLHYFSRDKFKRKHEPELIQELHDKFGDFYMLPEGGSNTFAIQGIKEFASSLQKIHFNIACVPVGTGGTLGGFVAVFSGQRYTIGFSVLKGGEFLNETVKSWVLHNNLAESTDNWHIETSYHEGGYGKVNPELLRFIHDFNKEHAILLDPIYTGKMMKGVFDLIQQGKFKRGSTILAIHTGGLQGWSGIKQQ